MSKENHLASLNALSQAMADAGNKRRQEQEAAHRALAEAEKIEPFPERVELLIELVLEYNSATMRNLMNGIPVEDEDLFREKMIEVRKNINKFLGGTP